MLASGIRVLSVVITYHKIGVLVVGIVEQPLLGASSVGELEETATRGRESIRDGSCTALNVTWIIIGDVSFSFVSWDTGLARRLDQGSSNGSITVETIAQIDISSDGTTVSSTRRSEASTREAAAGSLASTLLGALLESSAGSVFKFRGRSTNRDSLLGRSHRKEGKDKEDLFGRVHFVLSVKL